MKKDYRKLFALALCLYGWAGAAVAQDYGWDFTDKTLWTASLATGYYTPEGGSTVSETAPADSKYIYVCSASGLMLSAGSHYQVCSRSNTADTPSDDYIKVEVPAGYTVKVSMMRSNINYGNAAHLLVKAADESVVENKSVSETSFTECEYKNEGAAAVSAYVYTAATQSKRLSFVQSVRLTRNATEKHTYTVKFTDGTDDLQDALTGECIEKEDYTVNVPKVIVKDGAYYVLDGSDERKDFRETFTMGGADETKEVKYTKDESVVFFEDYSGVENSAASGGSTRDKLSKGQSFTVCEALPAGQYELSANKFFYGRGRTENVMTDGETIAVMPQKEGVSRICFNLAAEGDVSIGTNANSDYYDYVLIRKTGDAVTAKSVDITAAGYATYVTEYAMDFSGSGVEAYVVSSVDTGSRKVTLEKVDRVPAGEAVIVKGGTAEVPVCNSAAAVENEMKYSAAAIDYAEDAEKTYYVLAMEGDKVVFAPVTSGTIAAGKGYIAIDKAAAAGTASYRLSFGLDNPTAISKVEAGAETAARKACNMAGQRVDASAKGIVIINGKKILNK